MIGKRTRAKVAVAVTFGLLLLSCGQTEDEAPTAGGQKLETVKVATLLSLELNLPFWVAKSQGFYEDAGLEVEESYLLGGVAVRDAMASRDADVGLSGTFTPVQARAEGIPLSVIADWYDAELWVFMVADKKRDEIKSIDDLKGRVIVTSPPGSVAWGMTRGVLQAEGIDPERDVKILAMPDYSPESWLNMLESGDADAAVTWEPFQSFLLERNAAVPILSMRNREVVQKYLGGDTTSMAAFTHESIVSEKPDTLKAFVEATDKGIDFIQSSSADELAEIVAPFLNLETDVASTAVEGSLESFVGGVDIDRENYTRLMEFFLQSKLISKPVEYEEAVAEEFSG